MSAKSKRFTNTMRGIILERIAKQIKFAEVNKDASPEYLSQLYRKAVEVGSAKCRRHTMTAL